jgi:hypothetical protein
LNGIEAVTGTPIVARIVRLLMQSSTHPFCANCAMQKSHPDWSVFDASGLFLVALLDSTGGRKRSGLF